VEAADPGRLAGEIARRHILIIPTGLYYTAKQTFRSSALVVFGVPIIVEPVQVDEQGEPPREAVDALTAQIESALADVTLQADSHEALDLIERAERIFSAGQKLTLAEELELRKQFVAGYNELCERDPARVGRLAAAIREIDPPPRSTSVRAAYLFLLPFGLVGAVIHWPIYRLIGIIARFAGSETRATVKLIAGAVFYPAEWIAIAWFTRWYVALLLPILGYCAILASETIERLRARKPDVSAIRAEIVRVAEEITGRSGRASGSPGAAPPPSPRG